MAVLRLGTRASALARAQADLVARTLAGRHPGLSVEPVYIRTSGDRLARGPLPGGKGLFVKEIEEALLARTIDAAVHSMKDLPARLAPGLAIGAVPARADARDVLVAAGAGGLTALRPGTRIGTASVRRRAQLLARRRDLVILFLRGNVDTRLARWRAGGLDALLLAAAGLARLGIDEPAARPLAVEDFLPAIGQGALALECRADDAPTLEVLGAIEDAASATAIAAERSFLLAVGGDCNTPIAAHATVAAGRVTLRAAVSDPEGTRWLEDSGTAAATEAMQLGRALAERLLAAGAAELLGR
ncbi:MAG TPA: hydroxymethylbilane synthase [Candidatus Binatia bacterium]|nr:hydroxymethylbilane synthase [Candidatus Binatia bacterium]